VIASPAEIRAGLRGAWRLMRRDAGGLGDLNLTVDGFWRSFTAILVAAPLDLIYEILPRQAGGEGPDDALGWLVAAIVYLARWLALPVVLALVATPLGWAARYPTFVIAYNWTAVLQLALLVPAAALARYGLLPGVWGQGFVLGVTLGLLLFAVNVSRIALGVGAGAAVGVVMLDLVLGLGIEGLARLADQALG